MRLGRCTAEAFRSVEERYRRELSRMLSDRPFRVRECPEQDKVPHGVKVRDRPRQCSS